MTDQAEWTERRVLDKRPHPATPVGARADYLEAWAFLSSLDFSLRASDMTAGVRLLSAWSMAVAARTLGGYYAEFVRTKGDAGSPPVAGELIEISARAAPSLTSTTPPYTFNLNELAPDELYLFSVGGVRRAVRRTKDGNIEFYRAVGS